MAYIGAEPVPGQNREVDDISSGFNGNATAFTLQVSSVNVSPESANNILINLGGVLQNPGTDYTVAASTLTFTTAPAAGLSFFGLILGAGINTATVADDTIGASKLIDTAVTAGSYTTADITVDAQGRITAAASGSISNAEIADNAVTTAKIADSTGSSDGVTTAKLATDAVTAAKLASNSVVSDSIVDGSIVNADVNASAAIAGTKISPDFGSQNIATTGSATIGSDLIHAGDTDTKIGFGTDTISLTTNNVTRMTFTGNFIDLPDAGTLRLGNSNDLQISHGSGGASNIVHSNTSQPLKISATGAGNIALLTNSNERMRVDSSGNVIIGATSATNIFTVQFSDSSTSVSDQVPQGLRINNTDNTLGRLSGLYFTHGGGGSANNGIFSVSKDTATASTNAGSDLAFYTKNNGQSLMTEKMRIDSSGNVGIGTGTPANDSDHYGLTIAGKANTGAGMITFKDSSGNQDGRIFADNGTLIIFSDPDNATSSSNMVFRVDSSTAKLRLMSDNEGFRIGGASDITFDQLRVASGTSPQGCIFRSDGSNATSTSNQGVYRINRTSSDGTIINFLQNGTSEGSIDVSGSTVSYNGGHLSRWSQLSGISSTDKSARPTIYQGTVMSNLDELCTWTHADLLYEEDILYMPEETLPEGKSVGDIKHAKGDVLRAGYTEENQQLNMTKVSDTEGDKDVAGVFWAWDDDDDEIVNDFFVAMTGDMVIRVAASTTVARGDLLISAGDGTAKPQADDIVRSSTIAKIISTNHTATYADGSKAYPCVLMAC